MGESREGGCSCGQVRYRLTAEPLFVHCCHCRNCQRQTGSAFVINLLIERDRVELLAGDPAEVPAARDAGPDQLISRCPTCHVAVFSTYTAPEILFVRGGTLDDPTRVVPDVHIYTRSKVGWLELPEDAPASEAFYDPKSLWPTETRERYRAATAAERSGT